MAHPAKQANATTQPVTPNRWKSHWPFSNRRSGSKSRSHVEASDLARVNLSKHRWSVVAILLTRAAAIAAILTGIVFGASHKIFGLGTKKLLGNEVNTDTQLALLGFVNKILDLLVTKSLENSASLLITAWMALADNGSRTAGARLADFELPGELTKPWLSIAAFYNRGQELGWGWRKARWTNYLRFIVTLAISVCVLLLGVAINTVAVPKERWFPDGQILASVNHPMMVIHDVNWFNFWDLAWGLVGGGDLSYRVTDSLIEADLVMTLTQLRDRYIDKPYGWRDTYENRAKHHVGLDTRYNGSSARGVGIASQQVQDLFDILHANGNKSARSAVGWTGNLTLLAPSASVSCVSSTDFSSVSNTVSVLVNTTLSDDTSNAFHITLAPQSSLDFTGLTCDVSFERLLFPVGMWITSNSGVDLSVNAYNQDYNHTTLPLPYDQIDTVISKALSIKMAATLSRLESWTDGLNAAELLLLISRNFRLWRSEFTSDVEVVPHLINLIANHHLATARWNITYTSDYCVTSTNIRWQLYGSGPRLLWEWLAVTVLGILLIPLILGIAQSIRHPIAPGEWLKVGGMLVAANMSPSIQGLEDTINKDKKTLAGTQFVVREVDGQGDVARIIDVHHSSTSKILDRRREYRWK